MQASRTLQTPSAFLSCLWSKNVKLEKDYFSTDRTYLRKILDSAEKWSKRPSAGPCRPRDSFEQTSTPETELLISFVLLQVLVITAEKLTSGQIYLVKW